MVDFSVAIATVSEGFFISHFFMCFFTFLLIRFLLRWLEIPQSPDTMVLKSVGCCMEMLLKMELHSSQSR